MTATASESQQWLADSLDRVYATLCGAEALAGGNEVIAEPNPLSHLRASFGLTVFECDLMLLLLGCELESRFLEACAEAAEGMKYPTFGLALAKLAEPHWSALSVDRPLRYWMLIELGEGERTLSRPLRLDERIVHFLMGLGELDSRLSPLISALPPNGEATADQLALARTAAEYWSGQIVSQQTRKPLVITGRSESDCQAVVQAACEGLNLRPAAMNIGDIPASPVERERLSRIFNREAILTGLVLYLRAGDVDSAEAVANARAFLRQIAVPVTVEAPQGSALERMEGFRVQVPEMEFEDRLGMWTRGLAPVADQLNGEVERIAESFRFSAANIEASAALICHAVSHGAGGSEAWRICRTRCRQSIEHLAKRIEPRSSRENLILPSVQREILGQILVHARHRSTVDHNWGFARRYTRGLGFAALFSGPSGTGKTMAAEILAGELQRDLFQIDLASVVSKYIGETEKNLKRIFDAADEGGAVLLFDEADALFGKRSEVRDSHDRYANLEISYLLQRMEAYRGIAILTTNMERAMDDAFVRRLRFIVHFPFPDAQTRRGIWMKIFPVQTPLSELNYDRLAQLSVTGGTIRNIATHAAFLAADQGSSVGMDHLLGAARLEYAKLGRPLTKSEIGGWS